MNEEFSASVEDWGSVNATLLAVNAGSSSLRFALFAVESEPERQVPLTRGSIAGIGHHPQYSATDRAGRRTEEELAVATGHEAALAYLLERLDRDLSGHRLIGAGHRVVHGGDRFREPVRVDGTVLQELHELVALAPLHEPHNIAAIEALARLHPELPQVACFDTAFHAGQPAVATAFALPRDLTGAGVRRYGFHGLSYEYIASVLPAHLGAQGEGRVIVAHLGSGASMCALHERRSVATTMGFSALDGLPMGTRCGALDPGVILYLLDQGLDARAISAMLWERSGLLGVSGLTDDMRELLASDDPRAQEAIALFCYRAVREIGSLTAALGGLDALVFTAGIGEHAAQIRERICIELAWLGVDLDRQTNAAARDAARISSASSRLPVWVIPTDEEATVAKHVVAVLRHRP